MVHGARTVYRLRRRRQSAAESVADGTLIPARIFPRAIGSGAGYMLSSLVRLVRHRVYALFPLVRLVRRR
eukprot:3787800-Pyramimonas_sp.AAC.1